LDSQKNPIKCLTAKGISLQTTKSRIENHKFAKISKNRKKVDCNSKPFDNVKAKPKYEQRYR
jgi:hypothetical protein